MTQTNGYHDYPANKPQKDDYYLVSVKSPLHLRLGLSPSPAILIAKFNSVTQEWTATLGISSVVLGNIADDVISWRELPRP